MDLQEFPLVLFTLLTQTAVGLALVAAVHGRAVAEGPEHGERAEWGAVLGLLVLGVAAAFFHLGQPLGAFRMVANLKTAWLSREILAFAVFGVLAVAAAVVAYRGRSNGWLIRATALVGLVALIATGMTYAAPSMPAIHNTLPLVFFGLTAVTLGVAAASYFVPEDTRPRLAGILSYALVVALVVYLVVPFVWLAGGALMHETGQAFLTSPLYWGRILLGLALPLAVVWRTRSIPAWLPVLLVLGELAGRIVFFGLVAASGANIGMPY